MIVQCPSCHSARVVMLHRGRKVCGSIGTVAGATSGIAAAAGGARIGMAVGVVAGPAGSVLGGAHRPLPLRNDHLLFCTQEAGTSGEVC